MEQPPPSQRFPVIVAILDEDRVTPLQSVAQVNMSNQGKDFNSVVAQEDSDSSESDNETPAAAAASATATRSIFDSDSSESDSEPPKLERFDTPVTLSFSESERTSPPTLEPMVCAKGGKRFSEWTAEGGPYRRGTRSAFPKRGRLLGKSVNSTVTGSLSAAPSASPAKSDKKPTKKEASPKE
ncbi:hypothetical protein LSTR_LSTR007073 [Laodelphax striatellus]|uniref:Uncharacterized protein n=1 Tax=Laodelphax striatellus TaxID=195883 RepID=A0A482WJJ1_LAOST|nr:hypothetical protein LSTR_LSTR007073 [Laodelphax striatellus]